MNTVFVVPTAGFDVLTFSSFDELCSEFDLSCFLHCCGEPECIAVRGPRPEIQRHIDAAITAKEISYHFKGQLALMGASFHRGERGDYASVDGRLYLCLTDGTYVSFADFEAMSRMLASIPFVVPEDVIEETCVRLGPAIARWLTLGRDMPSELEIDDIPF